MQPKPYSLYKPSNVRWLGNVPEHWEIKKLGYITKCLDGKRIPLNSEERSYKRGIYPYWGANGVLDAVDSWLFDEKLILLGEDGAPFFEKNKTVAFFVTGKIWVNNHAHVLRPNRQFDGRFIAHSLNNTQFGAFIDGSTRDKLTQSDMNSIPIACPPLEEQRAIANYLNFETGRIEVLVSKKREIIKRLKEKRIALISHVVTRGLPPDAAIAAGLDPLPNLKSDESIVDWFGEIPEHWMVRKFSREITIAGGQVNPELDPYLDMLLVAPNHIESGTGKITHQETAAEQAAESGKYQCHAGDVIYSKIRPALAKVTIAPQDCLCSADMYPLRGRTRFEHRFIFWLFLSKGFTAWSILESDRVAMPKINRETLNELRLPVPPLDEQRAIADYLDRETIKIDHMSEKIKAAIEKLLEYRTALITAAVTGKIDVRGEQV